MARAPRMSRRGWVHGKSGTEKAPARRAIISLLACVGITFA